MERTLDVVGLRDVGTNGVEATPLKLAWVLGQHTQKREEKKERNVALPILLANIKIQKTEMTASILKKTNQNTQEVKNECFLIIISNRKNNVHIFGIRFL